jgi:uncharacterized protein YaaN involved in tellurite resistance
MVLRTVDGRSYFRQDEQTRGERDMATQTATAGETKLTLEPPAPLQPVLAREAAGLVPIDDSQRTQLEQKADQFISELVAMDANSPDFGRKVDQLTNMGRKEITEAAGASNRFLDRPVKAIDADNGVGNNLLQLRRVVEDLDPGRNGALSKRKKLFGLIPFGNSLTNYFQKYQSSQTHISKILGHLASGKDELLKDNAAIDVERANLWKTMGRLEQMIHISKTLDARLEQKAGELDATDPAKAKAIRETALFYTRQRTQDLLTQMAVTVQGYLALDLVKKNNVELVKGVDRASTTTVAALRTAVTVAQALTNQRLVLEQITALNTTTAGIIDRTGELLKSQTAEIHKQAASSTIPLETLQRAFQNIYDTMDAVDTFKLQALGSMKQTVDVLSTEVEKSRGYIARAEGVEQNRLTAGGSQTVALRGDRGVGWTIRPRSWRIRTASRNSRSATTRAISARAVRRPKGRGGTASRARKITHIGIAVAAVLVGMVVLGLVIDGIGLTGLFIALALMLGAILVIGFMPTPAARPVALTRKR